MQRNNKEARVRRRPVKMYTVGIFIIGLRALCGREKASRT